MGNAHSSGTPLTALQSCLNTACTGSVGCVAFPTEPLYQLNWVKAYNLAIDITPAAVLRPQTAEQISAIVQCAAQNNMKVQAKSGGHSYGNYGLGGTDGEVMIDMVNFQQFSMDNSTWQATIGAGTLLGDVTTKLSAAGGRAMAHGVCPGVGVGGHATIGGLGPMSRMWGACLDHVLEVEVVTANGTILRANETLNSDLFWALKGSAAGFGIITEFVFRTHPEPGSVVQYSFDFTFGSSAETIPVFQAWQDMVVNPNLDRRFGTEFVLHPVGCLITGTFYGTEAEYLASGVPELLPQGGNGTLAVNNWLGSITQDAQNEALYLSSMPNNFYSKSLGFRPQDKIAPAGIETLFKWLDTANKGTLLWFIIFDATGGAVSDIPMNATAYAHRDKFMFYQSYGVGLFGLSNTTKTFLTEFHEQLLSVMPNDTCGTYPGYVDPALTNGQEEYWGSNLPRLGAIKAALDPNDIFHNPQSVQPVAGTY